MGNGALTGMPKTKLVRVIKLLLLLIPFNAHSQHVYTLKRNLSTVYLFAVSHNDQAKSDIFDENLYNTFKSSNGLFVEIDFTNRSLMDEANKYNSEESVASLKYVLEDSELQAMHSYSLAETQVFKLNFVQFSHLNSCVAALLLTSNKQADPKNPVSDRKYPSREQYFLAIAKKLNSTVNTLEQPRELLFCDKLNKQERKAIVTFPVKISKNKVLSEAYYSELKKADVLYQQGKGDDFFKVSTEALNVDVDYKKAFLKWNAIRNQHMFSRISQSFLDNSTQSFFVAVGAFHVYGENGLLNKFLNAGFTLEQGFYGASNKKLN